MPSGAIAGPTSLRMAAATAFGRIAARVMVMIPPIDVPRKTACRNVERRHHLEHVAGVDSAAGSCSGWDRDPDGRGRARRGR